MENDETNQIAGFGEFRGLLANWEKKTFIHSSIQNVKTIPLGHNQVNGIEWFI